MTDPTAALGETSVTDRDVRHANGADAPAEPSIAPLRAAPDAGGSDRSTASHARTQPNEPVPSRAVGTSDSAVAREPGDAPVAASRPGSSSGPSSTGADAAAVLTAASTATPATAEQLPPAPLAADDDRPDGTRADVGDVVVPVAGVSPVGRVRRVVRPAAPDANLRVAHVLLRAGNVLPARVHLETLAGRHQLDMVALLDLAESRWRTGDLPGAGEAVAAYLDAGGESPLGYVIAAEATTALGRPNEARKLARQALEGLDEPLDGVFAGQRRAGIWPHDPAAPVQPAGSLFAPPVNDAMRGGRIGLTADPVPTTAAPTTAAAPTRTTTTPATATTRPDVTVTPPLASPTVVEFPPVPAPQPAAELQPEQSIWDAGAMAAPDAGMALDTAREALESGDRNAAVVQLAIALRMRPALAPMVLDLVGQLPGPEFDLLRGDALRLVGHEAAAERAFAAAADALRTNATIPPRSRE